MNRNILKSLILFLIFILFTNYAKASFPKCEDVSDDRLCTKTMEIYQCIIYREGNFHYSKFKGVYNNYQEAYNKASKMGKVIRCDFIQNVEVVF